MIKRLIQNTIISTIAFGAAAILGLIVIPVIIRTWGVTEFGLIVITRLLLPSELSGWQSEFRSESAETRCHTARASTCRGGIVFS